MITARRKNKPPHRRWGKMFNWRGLDAMTDAELLNVSEAQLQFGIVTFLQDNYPDVPFKCDTSAVKTTIGQARKMKQLGNTKAWPDLFIAVPANGYHGFFLEIKKGGTILYNKKDEFATDHIREQGEMLNNLWAYGYVAIFGVGWLRIKSEVISYLRRAEIY